MLALEQRADDATGPAAPRSGTGGAPAVRADIQALRAVAVSLVVLYHLWPLRLPGGFIGVDVFFVLSGFLITSHLVREVQRTGSVDLARFWARRARRLLPASLLVLLVTAGATLLLVPQASWQPFLHEVGASALYVQNWSLAAQAVDYLAADAHAAPTQHYWSLSAEEQFYLVWPLLILLAAALTARRLRARTAAVTTVLALVTAASFAYSLHLTATAPQQAYFVTPARAWQFGAGGLLALVAGRAGALRGAGGSAVRAALAWAGYATIAVGALVITGRTPFPGTAALVPVLGALAVVAAGEPRGRWSPEPLARLRPVRWLGDVSYSLYLWHWPPIVVVPLALGHHLTRTEKVAILVGALVAAQLTKVRVEDPLRSAPFLTARRARVTFAAAAAATAVVVAVSAGGWAVVQHRIDAERAAVAQLASDPCFGAGAMDPDHHCTAPHTATGPINTAFARKDLSAGMDCLAKPKDSAVRTCRTGPADARQTVALIGDSHAASWYEAVTAVARKEHWAVVTYVKAGCPALGSDRLLGTNMSRDEPPLCRTWSRQVLHDVAADPSITQVFTGYRSDLYKYVEDDGQISDTIPAAVVQRAFRQLTDAGKSVHVLRAFPTTDGFTPGPRLVYDGRSVPDCIAAAGTRVDPCATDRAHVVVPDQLADAATAMHDPAVDVVDLTGAFCDARRCHAYTGGVVVYWDDSHITRSFSRSLAAPLFLGLHLRD